eukprot:m51a1_g2075 hypothetical protein (342) ;mRNA; r:1482812-1484351
MEAKHWVKLEGDKVQCKLCPNECVIAAGRSGVCRVRVNEGGALRSLAYAHPVSLSVDPVEKKPLFHFLPASDILSLGTLGCNLRCTFCQNSDISQATAGEIEEAASRDPVTPQMVVDAAIKRGCPSIAYTYNEPTVFYEFVLETAKLARSRNLRNVLVSNGYISPEPLDELYPYIDAVNIDLKSFTEQFYHDVCGAKLSGVLAAIERVATRHPHVWVELTTLVIPTLNDSDAEMTSLATWVRATLGDRAVLHLSRYFPRYKMAIGPTPPATLERLRGVALRCGVPHVYVGNVRTEGGEDTRCPKCSELLVERRGYSVRVASGSFASGRCLKCGAAVPGVWA